MNAIDSDWFTFDKKGNWAEAVFNTLMSHNYSASPFAKELYDWIDENPNAKNRNLANKMLDMLSERLFTK